MKFTVTMLIQPGAEAQSLTVDQPTEHAARTFAMRLAVGPKSSARTVQFVSTTALPPSPIATPTGQRFRDEAMSPDEWLEDVMARLHGLKVQTAEPRMENSLPQPCPAVAASATTAGACHDVRAPSPYHSAAGSEARSVGVGLQGQDRLFRLPHGDAATAICEPSHRYAPDGLPMPILSPVASGHCAAS